MPGGRGLSSCAAETPLKKIKLLSNTKHRPRHCRAVFILSFGSMFVTLSCPGGVISTRTHRNSMR
jgi:hypothetical protein